jgi:CheY-like chemotaxis protein
VLLAEDHPINRKVTELVLQPAEVDLTTVENGHEAVQAFSAGGFDMVLMDIQMPVMDGLDATRAIRALEARAGSGAVPIVMLTAHNLPNHVRASLAAGADRHLSKPINAAELLRTIGELAGAGVGPAGGRLSAGPG